MSVIHENASKEASNETEPPVSNHNRHDVVKRALNYLGDIEYALDRQIYPLQQIMSDGWSQESYADEFAVVITAKEWRAFGSAMALLSTLSRTV